MHKFKYVSESFPISPDFHNLPWELPLPKWTKVETRVEEIQHGISRHPVIFINMDGSLFVIKELPSGIAKKEYDLLAQMQVQGIPSVKPIGHGILQRNDQTVSILFTRFLDASVPA